MPPASEPCKSEKRFMSAYREEVYVSVYRSASCVCPGGERREMTFLSGANKQTNKKKMTWRVIRKHLLFPPFSAMEAWVEERVCRGKERKALVLQFMQKGML